MKSAPAINACDLHSRVISDAVLSPVARLDNHKLLLGAYDGNHEFIEEIHLKRSKRIITCASNEQEHEDVVEIAIYGGIVFGHFGHFLTETLSRYWYWRERSDTQIVFHSFTNSLLPCQKEIFTLLGLEEKRIRFVSMPVKVKKLILPVPGVVLGQYFDCRHLDILGVHPVGKVVSGRRIWLSRSQLDPVRQALISNEQEIELELQEKHGYTVIHPESVNLVALLDLLATAERIAGFEGSAFYNLMLLETVKADVRVIPRGVKCDRNFQLLFDRKSIAARICNVPGFSVGDQCKKRVRDFVFMSKLDVFRSLSTEDPPMTKPSSSLSAKRLNRLAQINCARSYLEIGVAKGRTFFDVDVSRKTAVDPKFRFQISALSEEVVASTRMLEMTSDDFFSSIRRDEDFDLIFIDGLHTFEQCFRDLLNTFAHANEKTIWLIDDTVPNDVFSTLRNGPEALNYRREAGLKGKAWHGDVFKVVFAIHDFIPTISYRTLIHEGNPQTVLWRQARANFAPRFDSFETISRMDYFDFKSNFDLLFATTEDELLDILRNLA